MAEQTSWSRVEGSFIAPLELSYPYNRTVGTQLSRFFTSLMDSRLEGTRGSDGRVYFPPAEFDPLTGERLSEWVDVADTGSVLSWTWQAEPEHGQPLDHPFAWALVNLDGADVPILHAVDAKVESNIATGSRVKVRWAENRTGGINDIACFDLLSTDNRGASQ